MEYSTVLVFISLFMLSAFFSWTEIALMSLAKHKIDSLVKQWVPWAKDLQYIKQYNDRLLITILIWNNLVNTYTAALATTIAISIASNSGIWLNESTAIWLSTWIITFLILLFGEIAPKSFATKNAESIALLVAKFYKILLIVLYPFVIVIEFITKLMTWKSKPQIISEEEIQAFIDMWRDTWTLAYQEHEHLRNLLDFGETTAEDIMTPRIKIDKISHENTVQEAKDFIVSHTHSRIPVYKEDVDHIVWIVNIRLLLAEIDKWNADKKLKDIQLIKAIKVPLNKPIDWLLKSFQKSHQHINIVIDEYGGVAWIVTLEDVIEEVFGEIQDEFDKEEESIKKISENQYLFDSWLEFEDILKIFNLETSDFLDDDAEYCQETISYFITDYLERFPIKWEVIKLNLQNERCLTAEVTDISDGVIGKIKISLEN